jgi:hypothetical protein
MEFPSYLANAIAVGHLGIVKNLLSKIVAVDLPITVSSRQFAT